VSEQEEDFATMFEASVKARRFERGQTIEGTIVAFGSEVAFVSVGGKSEAQIDLAELKDDDGDIEVSIGDRIQAVVVSTSGGVTLSRKGVRNAATQRELENAFEAGLAWKAKSESAIKGGYEVRHRARACLLSVLADRHRRTADPACTSARLSVPDPRVQGRRQVHRRFAAEAARRRNSRRLQRPSANRSSLAPVLPGPRGLRCSTSVASSILGGGIQGLLHVS
jgi:small subunit ribosomal protein S1